MKKTLETPSNHCNWCKFFNPIVTMHENPGATEKTSRGGNCKRRAPILNQTNLTLFPYVERDNWCGDFKANI